jgi:hypothetical protein
VNTITRGLPFCGYLELEWLNFSALKAMDVSPLHYQRAVSHQKSDTRPIRMGRLLHALLLTPDLPSDVAVWNGARRGKEWEAFETANADHLVVKVDELVGVDRMREAVLAHPIAADLLRRGEGEVTLQWEQSDVQCRGRLDWLRPDGSIVELKTTRSIDPRLFAREVSLRHYYAQVAFYSDGLATIVGREAPILPHMIVVENVPPFDVAVYRIGYDAIEAGRRKVDAWLRRVKECAAADRWPGVDGGAVLDMRLPDWALSGDGEDVDLRSLGSLGGEAA